MIPRVLLATAKVPGRDSAIELHQHDRDFIVRVDRTELMTSREHGSEEALAELAIESLFDARRARVLVGGLGMGYTLARVLALVGPDASVEVVELVPEMVAWNREWFGALNGHPLDDPRVRLVEADLAKHLRSGIEPVDAILLDVDNGPEGLVRPANSWLYGRAGLAAARDVLRPRGVLAVWASVAHDSFSGKLRAAGFTVEERRVKARRTKGPKRTIWVGTRTSGPGPRRPPPQR